ncbi:Uncharacterised protein [Helicobacter mustelae]|nr:Uncharacterised protein [Helicobacter mustelae]
MLADRGIIWRMMNKEFTNCVRDLLAMKKNRVFHSYDWSDVSAVPTIICQLYIIEFLLSMEGNKLSKAKSIYLKIKKDVLLDGYSRLLDGVIKGLFQSKYRKTRRLILSFLRANPTDIYLFYVCHI